MAATSSASTVWEGDLAHGSGLTTPDSGAFPAVEVSWSSRTERAAGATSPEELLAAAHASCFCMAELAFLFERDAADPAFDSFGDAIIWACAVVLALQADPLPATTGGRLVMLAGFAFGLILVASLAGTLGAFLVDGGRERRGEQ